MIVLTESAWRILERAEYLHDRGVPMAEIAADTGQTPAQLSYLALAGPAIRDALERAIREAPLHVRED